MALARLYPFHITFLLIYLGHAAAISHWKLLEKPAAYKRTRPYIINSIRKSYTRTIFFYINYIQITLCFIII